MERYIQNASKQDYVVTVAVGTAGLLCAVQFLTTANPVGRCWTFWKQLGVHVSHSVGLCDLSVESARLYSFFSSLIRKNAFRAAIQSTRVLMTTTICIARQV